MTHPSNLEYQRRAIERERAAGLIRRTVTIPAAREAELKAIVARWVRGDSAPSEGNAALPYEEDEE